MNKLKTLLILLGIIILSQSCGLRSGDQFFVSLDGDDANSGSKSQPFKTLEKARDAIRKLKVAEAFNGCQVFLREGTYFRTKTFVLDENDSGTENSPIVYAAYKNEKVVIHGGITVSSEKAKPIKDDEILSRLNRTIREKIVEIDLNAIGLTDLGEMRPVGFSRPFGPAWAELFVNGAPYSIARWPNDSTVKIGKIVDTGSVPRDDDFSNRGGAFTFDSDRPLSWKSQDDIWISGYFKFGWAEDAVELTEIDTINKIFRTKQPSLYGFGTGAKFNSYYIYNVLEEIDQPGEFYIDRKNGKLYFYPKEQISEIEISVLEKPMVSMLAASNIQFEGISFECARGMGIYMERTNNNLINSCTFKNLGLVGVCMGRGIKPFENLAHEGIGEPGSEIIGSYLQHIYKDILFNRNAGTNNGVVNCTIYNTGAGGVHLSGGDRVTLEPGNNYVENCTIHDFNRIEKSYRAGIDISGVGNRISNCEIYNAPSMAILMRGNDHLFEYNEIHHVCQEVHDQGALYYGRDPSERGHVVRYNFFHHLNTIHATSAVYHDDGACGMEVFGNVFYKPGKIPVLIGGGHDNPYTNNIFIDAELGIHLDNRNQGWSKAIMLKDGTYDQRLKMVKYNEPPYSTKYPHLANYWEDNPALPKRNPVSKNIFYKVKKPVRYNKDWMPFKDDNWITNENPGFIDEANMNFMLNDNAKVFSEIPGFEPIPFDKIGVQKLDQ